MNIDKMNIAESVFKKGFDEGFKRGSDSAMDFLAGVTASVIHSFLSSMQVKNVIFNDPATIVFWNDGTKTVVKADGEDFDKEKGLAMAIAKKAFGNSGNYYEVFKKYCPEETVKP